MSSVVLCHGFNIKDGGKATTDMLRKPSEDAGFTVLEADYGHTSLIAVRFFSDNIASVVAGMTPQRSIGVGHSNGCNILLQAAEQGASFDTLIFINPALNNDFKVPMQVNKVIVIHNIDDNVVQMSKFLPFHRWGNAGKVGYQGNDSRVENVEIGTKDGKAHSGAFQTVALYGIYANILANQKALQL
jgi:hypothetical protein